MRTTLKNTNEVCHIFAQRSQDYGKAGHVFFEKNTIYSYGHHFPAATFHDNKKGTVLLVNSRKYSSSTCKHLSSIRSACSQHSQIEVPRTMLDSKEDHKKNVEYFRSECVRYAALAMRARKDGIFYLESEKQVIARANKYISFFGLKLKPLKSQFNSKQAKDLIAKSLQQSKEERERKKQREIEYQKEQQENLSKWLIGEYHGRIDGSLQYLRLKGDTVQTSKNAEFPLSHAKLALHKIRQCVKNGISWRRNGEEVRVGTFHIDSIDEQGNVIAGCHKVEYTEIERFAAIAGL